jgi:hypothetical protein
MIFAKAFAVSGARALVHQDDGLAPCMQVLVRLARTDR